MVENTKNIITVLKKKTILCSLHFLMKIENIKTPAGLEHKTQRSNPDVLAHCAMLLYKDVQERK